MWLWQIPKNCTCLVLMLLLLVSMLTMSTRTTYILCICSKVSPTYTEDCLENCATKYIGHHVTSQWSAPTRTRKEILRVILSLIISTPKWIYKNWVNQSDVLCVTSQVIQKKKNSHKLLNEILYNVCTFFLILHCYSITLANSNHFFILLNFNYSCIKNVTIHYIWNLVNSFFLYLSLLITFRFA